MKKLLIAEKPSVAREFASILGSKPARRDGYLEDEHMIFTWCVGHLVAMSYPDAYDPSLKKWSLSTLPFLPETYRYEIIGNVKKQYEIVTCLMHSKDVETIYVCTDSGREGEYIYRLLEEVSGIPDADRRRVWIDSQTEAEILRGIKEAKPLDDYDNLAASAYLRAKEDYLMGINFSRLLTLSYSRNLSDSLKKKWVSIAVGRVMTCVLGMVVRREREIRNFVKTPFYKPVVKLTATEGTFEAEWKLTETSRMNGHPKLYKDVGFTDKDTAETFCRELSETGDATVSKVERKKEKKAPPLLYNLAELQNECSKSFKISPDETLKYAQELYEKKMLTYPRTDARVLSTAIAGEIHKNLKGLCSFPKYGSFAESILKENRQKGLAKTKYVDDKKITDHYAIIPTGEGLRNFASLSVMAQKVYGKVLLRFLSIFYPPAVYENLKIEVLIDGELFTASTKQLLEDGWYVVTGRPQQKDTVELPPLKKGSKVPVETVYVKAGETTPPKRYTTGSMILAMENAGNLIEDEELRAQIKGSGIGTSATRAEIIKKLQTNGTIATNPKTQVITPTCMGECIYQVVGVTIPALLDPRLTASWEKGLTMVANGELAPEKYQEKLEHFVKTKVGTVKAEGINDNIVSDFRKIIQIYKGA